MLEMYRHLLSPLMINGKFIKNRMGMSRAMPTVVTGCDAPEALETFEIFAGMMARNGAAIVTCASPVWKSKYSKKMAPPPPPPIEEDDGPGDSGHGPGGPNMGDPEAVGMYTMDGVDLNLPNNKNRYARAVTAIHSYGSLASISMMDIEPSGWSISTIPEEYLEGVAKDLAAKAEIYYKIGFDVVTFYMSYRNSLMAQSISPDLNRRTDRYGGMDIQERARFTFEVFRRTKEKCPGIIIEAQISGEDYPGGFTQEDLVTYVKLAEEEHLIDILQIRSKDGGAAHPIGMNSEKGVHDTLRFAEMLKASGTKIIIAPIGGYQDPAENDRIIAEGKADMIYMARAFICDSHYGEKLYEGRSDVTPCIRCNKCHTKIDDSNAGCSVNPEFILELYRNPLCSPGTAARKKRVAVIGGGPAGMEAAIVACHRGHAVTLYEKENKLGGQLLHSDAVSFKWPLKEFKDALIRRLYAAELEVCLGIAATPELLADMHYDVILYAAGAGETLPPIDGVEQSHVWSPSRLWGHEDELGERVVVIGGSETGIEAAYLIALTGRDVTILTRNRQIAPNAQPVHYMDTIQKIWQDMPNLKFVRQAVTTHIHTDGVTYVDKNHCENKIQCDNVIACGNAKAVTTQALAYAEITKYFRMIGDCIGVADLRHAMFSAYTAAAAI